VFEEILEKIVVILVSVHSQVNRVKSLLCWAKDV
jgi:hypothetical protein